MISRRSGLRIISVLMLLVLLGGYGYVSWQRLLERNAIQQLDWQGASLSLTGLDLAHLDLEQRDSTGSSHLNAQGLHLSWAQLSLTPPFLQHIRLEHLAVAWQPTTPNNPRAPTASTADLQQLIAAQLADRAVHCRTALPSGPLHAAGRPATAAHARGTTGLGATVQPATP